MSVLMTYTRTAMLTTQQPKQESRRYMTTLVTD